MPPVHAHSDCLSKGGLTQPVHQSSPVSEVGGLALCNRPAHSHPARCGDVKSSPVSQSGGKHKAPVGDSTRDTPEVALYWFEQERLLYAGLADRAW